MATATSPTISACWRKNCLSLFIRHSPQAEVYLTDSVRVTPSDPVLQMIYKFYWFLPPVEDIYPAPRPYSKLAESIPHGGDRKVGAKIGSAPKTRRRPPQTHR
jgi:hypothetical protein